MQVPDIATLRRVVFGSPVVQAGGTTLSKSLEHAKARSANKAHCVFAIAVPALPDRTRSNGRSCQISCDQTYGAKSGNEKGEGGWKKRGGFHRKIVESSKGWVITESYGQGVK
jgi:hypothetical protein